MNTPNPSPSTLKWALAISLAIHAALLTLRFAAPETFKRVFEDAPLEVILVNARSQESSTKAQALAQANLAGGGQTQSGLIATSPLPPAIQSEDGHDISDLQIKIEALKVQQFKLLTQLRDELTMLSQDSNTAPFDAFTPKMRSSADQIVEVSRFRFTRDEVLKTVIQNPSEQTP
jgi:protein TonB